MREISLADIFILGTNFPHRNALEKCNSDAGGWNRELILLVAWVVITVTAVRATAVAICVAIRLSVAKVGSGGNRPRA